MNGSIRPYRGVRRRDSSGVENDAHSGFTLVELILAGTLTAMVVVSAVGILRVAMSSHRDRRDAAGIYEAGCTALEIIRRDLLSVFLAPADDRTRFVGIDLEQEGMPSDQLVYVSTGYDTVGSFGGESDLMEVHYYLDNDSATEERWLQRRTDATPDDDPFTGGDNSLLGPHVVALDFQYYDGLDWWPSWESSEEIPLAVTVTLAVLDKSKAKPDDEAAPFQTTVWMPVHREGSGGGGEESGQPSSQPGGNQQPSGNQGQSGNQGGGNR